MMATRRRGGVGPSVDITMTAGCCKALLFTTGFGLCKLSTALAALMNAQGLTNRLLRKYNHKMLDTKANREKVAPLDNYGQHANVRRDGEFVDYELDNFPSSLLIQVAVYITEGRQLRGAFSSNHFLHCHLSTE